MAKPPKFKPPKFKPPTKKDKIAATKWLDSLPPELFNHIRTLFHNNNPIIHPDKIDNKQPLQPKHLSNFLNDQSSCPLCHSESLEPIETSFSPHFPPDTKELILCNHCGLNFKITIQNLRPHEKT